VVQVAEAVEVLPLGVEAAADEAVLLQAEAVVLRGPPLQAVEAAVRAVGVLTRLTGAIVPAVELLRRTAAPERVRVLLSGVLAAALSEECPVG